MLQMPFSRKGVTYPMRGSVYYPNLAVITVLLVGTFILYAVGQGLVCLCYSHPGDLGFCLVHPTHPF